MNFNFDKSREKQRDGAKKERKVWKYIREKKLRFPVIMLTAKIEDNDKIKGLTLRGR